MQCLWKKAPEIPIAIRTAHSRSRITLDSVIQIWELQRVSYEEHWGVVPDQIPVSLLGVKLHCESANVAFRIRSAAFTGHGRKTDEHRGLLTNLRKNLSAGIAGNVLRHGECVDGNRPFGIPTA